MSLLWPLSAIVAGAAGGAALLLMYMLRLRRRPVRVSSIAFWGDPPKDLEANVPLRMVRPAWMLLLQALGVALLALALGRPAIDAGAASTDRLYILIDTSASMRARHGADGGSRLDEAKQRAGGLIEGVGGLAGSQAMLITFASRARGVTPMTADRGALGAALDAIEGTDEAGDLPAALDLVGALIASQASEGDARAGARVVVLSDGAFEREAGRPLAGAAVEFVPVGRAVGIAGAPAPPASQELGRDNIGIVSLAARRDDREPRRLRVFLRLISVRGDATPLTVRFTIDGQELARRAVTIPGGAALAAPASTGDAPDEAAALTPGEHSLAVELDRTEGGVLEARLDRPDLLEGDNAAAVVLPPVQRPRVLLVTPDRDEFFLRGVLEELPPGWLRSIDPASYESPAGAELLAEADVVVFDRATPTIAPDRPTISFGAGLPLPGLEAEPTEPGGGLAPPGGSTGAAQWERSDPRLTGAWLDALRVARTIRLRPAEGAPVRTLVFGQDAPLIVERRDGPVRRLVVAFAPQDSNWPLNPGFAVFLASAIEDLVYAGVAGQGLSWRAGEAIPGLGEGLTEAIDASGRTAASGRGSVTLPRAGVYTLVGAGDAQRVVAVNMASEFESCLGVAPSLRVAGEQTIGAGGAPGPRELWFWFVLAAAIVLGVEWLVYLGVARS